MGIVAERERLIRNVVRLRQAEQASPEPEEIAAVRMDLERAIGPTVARAMAARLLGVSQTALDRWIALGDIPVVVNRAGHREVPLHALVELVEAVQQRERSGEDPHPLASVMRERRSGAQHLKSRSILPHHCVNREDGGHRGAELRSLAYHRVVSRRMDEAVVQKARHRLTRWQTEGRIDPLYASAWEEILSESPQRIADLIGEDTQRMADLRQSSPFAGELNEPERRAVLSWFNETAR